MSSVLRTAVTGAGPSNPRDKSFLPIFERHLQMLAVDRTQPVLVVGGADEDLEILSAVGFRQIVLSNLRGGELNLDAEDIQLPDDSYSIVFSHTVLHHCRCPQKALGEMVRVARQHVFLLEPNDSWALRLLVRLKVLVPYEVGITAIHDYLEGGMRNGSIPNYIYRWTEQEVKKCVAAYHPERRINVRAHSYWDLNKNSYWNFGVNENDPLCHKGSVVKLAETLGLRNFIRFVHAAQVSLNVLPPLRAQGNKFFCAISKGELQPWIEARNGQFYEKREYRSGLKGKNRQELYNTLK
jgi:SAM-dependent methyltransferase